MQHGARKAQIAKLKIDAAQYFQRRRFTTPKDKNAVATLRKIVALDRNNADAKEGFDDVVKRYISMAERALERDADDKARAYLNKAASVLPWFGSSKERAVGLSTLWDERGKAVIHGMTASGQQRVDLAIAHLKSGRLDAA